MNFIRRNCGKLFLSGIAISIAAMFSIININNYRESLDAEKVVEYVQETGFNLYSFNSLPAFPYTGFSEEEKKLAESISRDIYSEVYADKSYFSKKNVTAILGLKDIYEKRVEPNIDSDSFREKTDIRSSLFKHIYLNGGINYGEAKSREDIMFTPSSLLYILLNKNEYEDYIFHFPYGDRYVVAVDAFSEKPIIQEIVLQFSSDKRELGSGPDGFNWDNFDAGTDFLVKSCDIGKDGIRDVVFLEEKKAWSGPGGPISIRGRYDLIYVDNLRRIAGDDKPIVVLKEIEGSNNHFRYGAFAEVCNGMNLAGLEIDEKLIHMISVYNKSVHGSGINHSNRLQSLGLDQAVYGMHGIVASGLASSISEQERKELVTTEAYMNFLMMQYPESFEIADIILDYNEKGKLDVERFNAAAINLGREYLIGDIVGDITGDKYVSAAIFTKNFASSDEFRRKTIENMSVLQLNNPGLSESILEKYPSLRGNKNFRQTLKIVDVMEHVTRIKVSNLKSTVRDTFNPLGITNEQIIKTLYDEKSILVTAGLVSGYEGDVSSEDVREYSGTDYTIKVALGLIHIINKYTEDEYDE